MSACPECDELHQRSQALSAQAQSEKDQLPAAEKDLKDAIERARTELAPVEQEAAQAEAEFLAALEACIAARSVLQSLTGGALTAVGASVAGDTSMQPRPGWIEVDLGGGAKVWARNAAAADQTRRAAGAFGAQVAFQQSDARRDQALDHLRDVLQREGALRAKVEADIDKYAQKLNDLQNSIAQHEAEARHLFLEAARCDEWCERKKKGLVLIRLGSGLLAFGLVVLVAGQPFASATQTTTPANTNATAATAAASTTAAPTTLPPTTAAPTTPPTEVVETVASTPPPTTAPPPTTLATTTTTTAAVAVPTGPVITDACRGVAHNRSSQFTDAAGQPLTSPSVVLSGYALRNVPTGSIVTVTITGPTGQRVGTARVDATGRVIVASPIDRYGPWTINSVTVQIVPNRVTIDNGPAWADGVIVVDAHEVPCDLTMLDVASTVTTTPSGGSTVEASTPSTSSTTTTSTTTTSIAPATGGGSSSTIGPSTGGGSTPPATIAPPPPTTVAPTGSGSGTATGTKTGTGTGSGGNVVTTSDPTKPGLVAGGLAGLTIGGGLLGAGTLVRKRNDGDTEGDDSDGGDDPDTTGGDPDEPTLDDILDELSTVDPALVDRYLKQRLVEQRRQRGEESDTGTPPSQEHAGTGSKPVDTRADDAWVAEAGMLDKWTVVCQDAVNDPTLGTGIKEAFKQLADPKVIATMVALAAILGIVGFASAGVGYVLGAGLLVFFFGQQFFEFLDIVSDVKKADTQAELDAAKKKMTAFLIKVGPDWAIQLTTLGLGKIWKLFPKSKKPLPPSTSKPRPARPTPGEGTHPTEAPPSKGSGGEPSVTSEGPKLPKSQRPLNKGGVHTLPKPVPPAKPTRPRFTLRDAQAIASWGIAKFINPARLTRVLSRVKFREMRRDRLIALLDHYFPRPEGWDGTLGVHISPGSKIKGQHIWITQEGGVHSAIHEWIHALTNVKILKKLPNLLKEGLTEFFAKEISKAEGIPITPDITYEARGWTRVAEQLQKLLGEKTLKTLFFGDKGHTDLIDLARAVNKATGDPTAWAKLEHAAATENVDACLRILTPKVP